MKRIKHYYRTLLMSVKLKAVVINFYPVIWKAGRTRFVHQRIYRKKRCVYER